MKSEFDEIEEIVTYDYLVHNFDIYNFEDHAWNVFTQDQLEQIKRYLDDEKGEIEPPRFLVLLASGWYHKGCP